MLAAPATCRPRTGDTSFDPGSALLLKAMLESSIQRRFPKGLKVHVHSLDRFGCLAALTRVLQQVSWHGGLESGWETRG